MSNKKPKQEEPESTKSKEHKISVRCWCEPVETSPGVWVHRHVH